MREHEEISIESAEKIAVKSGYPIVIIFGLDPESGQQHVTTFGDTKEHSQAAARGGNILKLHLGWPEEYCQATPRPKSTKGTE